jgi:hypothetical protein
MCATTSLFRFCAPIPGRLRPFPYGRVSPDGRWIAYAEALPDQAPGTFDVSLKVWDVAAGGGHAIDGSTRYDSSVWTPGSLLEEPGGAGDQPGVTYDLVEPAGGQVVDTVSFQPETSMQLAWGSDGPVGLVIPSYWTAEEQVSHSRAAADRVAGMPQQNIHQAGLILRDPRSGGALNVLDASAGSLTLAATTTGTALLWAQRCLGLFETICSFKLHRVTLPGGDDQVVAVADSAASVAISPSGDRIAIAARDGIYVRDLP